jgi:SAM-dependent methyltransferase
MKLPFAASAFDLIVCQFGVMFFPDKRASFREFYRVLAPGGTYLFVLWDDYENMAGSPIWIATLKVADMLGRDPQILLNPGYYDENTIRADLAAAEFHEVRIERLARPAKASAREAAVITVHGSLLRNGNRSGRSLSSRRGDRCCRAGHARSVRRGSGGRGKQGPDRRDRKTAVTSIAGGK